MKRLCMSLRVLLASGALSVLLACAHLPVANQTIYPWEIAGACESKNFPFQVGKYLRDKMYTYRPGMVDVSIGYNRYDQTIQNAVTFYLYPRERSVEEQYDLEKRNIIYAHPGSTMINEKQITIQKDGANYQARIATFEYDGIFAREKQRVCSSLVLVQLPMRYFKARSSAPAGQVSIAETSMFELLERVSWANQDQETVCTGHE